MHPGHGLPSQPDSVPLAYELAEPRIVAQLPPPPVVTRGEADAVLGVRRYVLLQEVERLVPLSEQQPDERLKGNELSLAIDLRVDARLREHVPGAVAQPRPRQRAGHEN